MLDPGDQRAARDPKQRRGPRLVADAAVQGIDDALTLHHREGVGQPRGGRGGDGGRGDGAPTGTRGVGSPR